MFSLDRKEAWTCFGVIWVNGSITKIISSMYSRAGLIWTLVTQEKCPDVKSSGVTILERNLIDVKYIWKLDLNVKMNWVWFLVAGWHSRLLIK